MVTKDNSNAVQTYWVEAVYNGTDVHARTRVDLYPADCGETTSTGCALTGTLLYREDYGGNDPTDPDKKPTGIPQVQQYTYTTGNLIAGTYAINKKSVLFSGWTGWYSDIDDHTYPGDATRGYLIGFDANQNPGQFYECKIDNLCSGSELYISAWITSLHNQLTEPDKANMIFVIEDTVNKTVLARYYTSNIPDGNPDWKRYGFNFTIPDNITSIKLRIINNGTGTTGNDFVMDDIEIRFCAPQVTLQQPTSLEPAACINSSFSFAGEYTDDGTFTSGGGKLVYRWERNITTDPNDASAWLPIPNTQDSANSNSISSVYSINSVTAADTGYYRMVVANPSNIDNYYCRAMSDIVDLQIISSSSLYLTVKDTTACEINLRDLIIDHTVGSTVNFYADSLLTQPLSSTQKVIGNDTVFYAVSVDPVTGCHSVVQHIKLTKGTYPADDIPTTGPPAVCIGDTVMFTNATLEGGRWKVSNPSAVELIDKTPNSVKIRGVSEGRIFLSYIIGNNCTTIITTRLKVVTALTMPTILIGIERK
jgi:hypothetical protein